jgi:hypothetical protein
VTEENLVLYMQRIIRLCAAMDANPNSSKSETDAIRIICEHIIKDIRGTVFTDTPHTTNVRDKKS